jgi:hypothetical protein
VRSLIGQRCIAATSEVSLLDQFDGHIVIWQTTQTIRNCDLTGTRTEMLEAALHPESQEIAMPCATCWALVACKFVVGMMRSRRFGCESDSWMSRLVQVEYEGEEFTITSICRPNMCCRPLRDSMMICSKSRAIDMRQLYPVTMSLCSLSQM